MRIIIELSEEDLIRLGDKPLREVLGRTATKTSTSRALVPVNGTKTIGTRTLHDRISTEEIMELIRQGNGVTIHEIAARFYDPRSARSKDALAKLYYHVNKLAKQGRVDRREPPGGAYEGSSEGRKPGLIYAV